VKRRLSVLALALALSTTMVTVGAAPPASVFVVNPNDSGAGSFRDAIDRANANASIARVRFLGIGWTVNLESTVQFTGPQDLTIDGLGVTLDGSGIGSGPAFLVTGGGDLALNFLTVRKAPTEGIDVEVPGSATGTVQVSLFGVAILDNLGHGVLVNDQVDPLTLDPNGSDASVAVSVIASKFSGNGFSVSDRDGLRVNEGGPGHLTITVKISVSDVNGADGIEVDERADGDVVVDMFGSSVTRNGEFDPLDLDDGFDIDEAGNGSVLGKVVLSAANDNFEEGFDFNENDAGDLRVDMEFVEASRNREEGIDYEEDDDFAGGGDLLVTMIGIRTNGNLAGDGGLKIREKGVGNLDVTVNGVEASSNATRGIQIREDDQGNLVSSIAKATTLGNGDHGMDFDENRVSTSDAGDLTAVVANSSSSNNVGAGVRADQQTPGVGTLLLSHVTTAGNGGGNTAGSNVTVTIVP
jgi:hypothetical protein